jgi:4-amino-4-deoxy-L-arabinose transferase-like glycosyltransferase
VQASRAWLRLDYAAIVGVAAAVATLNAWWLGQYRAGGLIDIDEAGYLATSLEYAIAGGRLGLAGFWQAYQGHAPSAPLVPLAASLVYGVLGSNYMLAFGVLLLAFVAVVVCSAALALRIGGRAASIVTAVAVAGTPAIQDFTRTFQFAMPVAACFTAAILCMATSRGLRRTGPALGWGIVLGLMLLSRTMTVAFVPGFVVAAVLVAATSPNRLRAFGNLALGLAAMVLVAGTWYAGNWMAVRDYLLGYGYGSQSAAYGGGSPLSPVVLVEWIRRQVNEYLYLPMAAVLLAGAVAGIALLVGDLRARAGSARAKIERLARREWVPMAIPALAAVAALASSENQGVGFIVPMLPVATVLAVVALARLRLMPVRLVALLLVVVAAVAGVAGKSGLPPFDEGPVAVSLPGYGYATVFYPAGLIQLYELDGGYGTGTLHEPAGGAAWQPAERDVAQKVFALAKQTGRPPVCAFGFEDRFLNPNTLWLESSADFHYPIPSMWLDQTYGATSAKVGVWLDLGAANSVNVLITASGLGAGEIPPGIDQSAVAAAAAANGFQPSDHMTLPDGTGLTFWVRMTPPSFNDPYPFQPRA